MRRFTLNFDLKDRGFTWPYRFDALLRNYYAVVEYEKNRDPWACVNLFHWNDYIGNIYMPPNQELTWETHSWLKEKYRGYGIGALLYVSAIQFGFSKDRQLTSSDNPSKNAQRVWRSSRLRYLFRIKKKGKRFLVLDKKLNFEQRIKTMLFLDERVRDLTP